MRIITILIFCISLSIVTVACVSKNKYLELESDLIETQRSAEMTNENLITVQSQKTDLEKEYAKLDSGDVGGRDGDQSSQQGQGEASAHGAPGRQPGDPVTISDQTAPGPPQPHPEAIHPRKVRVQLIVFRVCIGQGAALFCLS